jgi:Tfp pilus assembly pilus retraction ATPase PilT
MPASRTYHFDHYSIPDLLKLLRAERGERIRLEAGLPPSLTIKGQDFEIDGPFLDEYDAEELLRTVADSRRIRAVREAGTVDFIYGFEGTTFLIRATRAFGNFNVELRAISKH